MASPETSQTLDRAVRLLELLVDAGAGRTVTELGSALGVARPVVYRLLATLEAHALIRRADDGRVTLGLGVLALARGVQPLLRDAAIPALRRLAEDVGATAHLTVVDGGEALALAVVEPSWPVLHVGYRPGARHALERGAAGRAILAARAADPPPYVVSVGELQAGAHGVAAPLPSRSVEGSVGVVAFTTLDEHVVGPRVRAAAAEVAAAFG